LRDERKVEASRGCVSYNTVSGSSLKNSSPLKAFVFGEHAIFFPAAVLLAGDAMKKTVLFLVFIAKAATGQPSLVWDNFHAPSYPQMARMGHITGDVTVELALSAGNTAVIQKSTSHPVLILAAEESIKASKLHCSDCESGKIFTVAFHFAVADHACSYVDAPSTAKLDNPESVSVIAEPLCTEEIDPVIHTKKVRGARCLYLWRCKEVSHE
jgi:hypothetical protein